MLQNVPKISRLVSCAAVTGCLFPEPVPSVPCHAVPWSCVCCSLVLCWVAGGGVSYPQVKPLTKCTVLVAGYVTFFEARQAG